METKEKLSIISVLHAKPGMEEQLKAHLMAIVPSIRRSVQGLINLDLHQDITDPTVFVLYENWFNEEAFEAYHRNHVPEDLAFRKEADKILAEPITPQRLRMLTPDVVRSQVQFGSEGGEALLS